MKILLTGGTGFIGQSLCARLITQGHTLTVLSRRPDKVPELCGKSVASISSIKLLKSDDHFDAIINLAGEGIADARWTQQRKNQLLDSRVGITHQLIDFVSIAESKPSVLISGSAVGYYGDQGDSILDEQGAFTDDFPHQLCAAWEQTAKRAADYEVRTCLLRTGLVIGKDGGFLKRMLLPFKLGLGGRIGDGKQWMSWVHREDLIGMIEYLLTESNANGVFNGTAPQPVTNREFSQCLAKLLNRPALLPVPALVLKLALGEMSTLLLGGQRVLPQRFIDAEFRFHFNTLEAALCEAIEK